MNIYMELVFSTGSSEGNTFFMLIL